LVLNIAPILIFSIFAIFFLTLGEMISFPYSNSFAMERSNRGKKGDYMAVYTLTFSFANIFGPNLGMHLSDAYGFKTTWFVMAVLMTLSIVILIFLFKKLQVKN